MKPAALWASLISVVLIGLVLLVVNIVADNRPILGLDLQGGVSVILAPSDDASGDDLLVVRDLIRDELESLGIAEPDVRVEGSNIVVDLPGVRDQREALGAVDVAGIVELRPVVLCGLGLEAEADGQDVLELRGGDQSCLVNPSGGTGEVFERGSARPTLDPATGAWGVEVDLRGDGEVVWNRVAAECFNASPECPSRQLAIVLDDVIQSAPQVNAAQFSGGVSITGNFTEDEARGLSRVLNRGAFPVSVEAESVETVSPALGGDTLRAAVISGLIGAVAIMVLVGLYYRRMALIAIAGLVMWAVVMYSATIYVSRSTNYALSLAGATGIIVAIGLAVDSYVVFFERLRDELRSGRSVRNATPRSFARSWRTIVSANVMALAAALVLFWLSVGSVRGFALYLGLTTVCNLGVYFFFARPLAILLSRTRFLGPQRADVVAGATS